MNKKNYSNRLLFKLFSDPTFEVDDQSFGYIARDIINMNWWNTAGVLKGYRKNKRLYNPFSETQKRIAVTLTSFYYDKKKLLCVEENLRHELRGYLNGTTKKLEILNAYQYPIRANPSQFFHTPNGDMTWIDCTSRASYAAKYLYQNGFIDFDGKCRLLDGSWIQSFIREGRTPDIGVSDWFCDGVNEVKSEIFSQKREQYTVKEWVDRLGIEVLRERQFLLDAISHVRTDPYKIFEQKCCDEGKAFGLNEMLYGFKTSVTFSNEERASAASHASRASSASHASAASNASNVSNASHESNASNASLANAIRFTGDAWNECQAAIKKPEGLEYPREFRKNIFGLAGNWKINSEIVLQSKIGWFDPFSGHGTSPLFAKKHGINYLGFDTNKRAFEAYLNIVLDEIRSAHGSSVDVRCQDSTVFFPELVEQFDLCYTSPPYFNFEEYGGNTSHFDGCETYDDYHEKITVPVFTNVYRYLTADCILALQTEKNKVLQKKWESVIQSIGFKHVSSGTTGGVNRYAKMEKRDQTLLVFTK